MSGWRPPRGSIVYRRTAPRGDEPGLVRPYVMTDAEWQQARRRPSRAVLRRVLAGLQDQGAGS